MRASASRAAAIAIIATLLTARASAQFGAEPAELELIKVKDDLYVVSNPYVPGLTTALISSEGVLLVDDKFAIDHDNIVSLLRTVTDQPIKYVINTHYHGDHSGGNAKLQMENAIVVASDQARVRMVEGNQPGLADFTLTTRASIHLGGKRVELYRVSPAHTDGDVVVLFPDHGVIATGDIFANGEGTSAQLVDHRGGGSAKQWPKAVEAALALSFDTVIPGHGHVVTRAELEAYHARTLRFSAVLAELVGKGRPRAEIESVVRSQFDWEDFHVQSALDGLIDEFR